MRYFTSRPVCARLRGGCLCFCCGTCPIMASAWRRRAALTLSPAASVLFLWPPLAPPFLFLGLPAAVFFALGHGQPVAHEKAAV